MQIKRKPFFIPVAEVSRHVRYVKGSSAFPEIPIEPATIRPKSTQELPPPLESGRFLTVLRRMEENSDCSIEDALGYSTTADFRRAVAGTLKQAKTEILSRPAGASLFTDILAHTGGMIEDEVTRRRVVFLVSEALDALARNGHYRLACDQDGTTSILSGYDIDESELGDVAASVEDDEKDEDEYEDDWFEEDEYFDPPTDREALEGFAEALAQLPTTEAIRKRIIDVVIKVAESVFPKESGHGGDA